MRDRVPEMEYFFCDTGRELPETYEYLQRLEAVLGKPIARLNAERDFDHWLQVYGARCRQPADALVHEEPEDQAARGVDRRRRDRSRYVGIRADENRDGYVSHKPNITAVFPFKEDGIDKDDILRILDEAGVGLPTTTSGGPGRAASSASSSASTNGLRLADEHPDLFEQAVAYEDKVNYEAQAMEGAPVHVVAGRAFASSSRAETRSSPASRRRWPASSGPLRTGRS